MERERAVSMAAGAAGYGVIAGLTSSDHRSDREAKLVRTALGTGLSSLLALCAAMLFMRISLNLKPWRGGVGFWLATAATSATSMATFKWGVAPWFAHDKVEWSANQLSGKKE